ncbi:MAG: hypothetical protein AB8B63_07010 [Granulosicoccus sp.]
MKQIREPRRKVLAMLGTLTGLFAVQRSLQAADLLETPKATEGPFYPRESMRPKDVDNDLVKVDGVVEEAGGEIIMLNGRVTEADGSARAGLRVEIWQCDVNGKYLHPGDSRDIAYDAGFQGFGHDMTNANGEYSFRTIKPTRYPGRTPHIHIKVLEGDNELLTSQFYIDGEPQNSKDRIFRRLSSEQAAAVSMRFSAGDTWPETTVDIVV